VTPRQHEAGSGVADSAARLGDDTTNTCDWVERALVFQLGSQRYGLPLDQVQEIQQIVAFSDVPSDGLGVVGMVNVRGDVVPAIDVRRLVGMDERAYTLETPMIIARSGGHSVALIVDEVEDVVTLPEGCLQTASPMHALSSKMVGVARLEGGLVYLLDVDRLITPGVLGEEPDDA
jgi:purine-binding chemotaxis protein CheW